MYFKSVPVLRMHQQKDVWSETEALPVDSEQNRQQIMTWEIEAGHIKCHNQPSGWYNVSSVGGPVRRRACLIEIVRKREKIRKPDEKT